MKTKMIVVGTGQAWKLHYEKTIQNMKDVLLIGAVDPALDRKKLEPYPIWLRNHISDIPKECVEEETVVLVLNQDHYPVLEKLVEMGFRKIICEKPLVSRMWEIPEVEKLRRTAQICAVDFYLPKTLGLQIALGLMGPDDPRYKWVQISDNLLSPEQMKNMLGDIEGASVSIVEAGDFCLPDIQKRPYLATDKETGGMILDLITHACGPLHQASLLPSDWKVFDASLVRLSNITTGYLVPVHWSGEVEIFVTALIDVAGIPLNLTFGKVPIEFGGNWTLAIRGTKGMFYAGLRTGQPAVLVANNGQVVTFSLNITTYEYVIRESLLWFEGKLPGFDGNFGAFNTSMLIGQAIRAKYMEHRTNSA